ncbi:MAG: hypothetical protein JSV88_29805 [Candidatus Aminicenantes bacterium]|nr:MAG: hypothetical protein JSV88_29805 [Candidatus Aminicenantes bacterium]
MIYQARPEQFIHVSTGFDESIENIITEAKIFCITGIGINLNHTSTDFPGELQAKAISLKIITGLTTNARDINPLLAALLFQWLEKLGTGAAEEIRE